MPNARKLAQGSCQSRHALQRRQPGTRTEVMEHSTAMIVQRRASFHYRIIRGFRHSCGTAVRIAINPMHDCDYEATSAALRHQYTSINLKQSFGQHGLLVSRGSRATTENKGMGGVVLQRISHHFKTSLSGLVVSTPYLVVESNIHLIACICVCKCHPAPSFFSFRSRSNCCSPPISRLHIRTNL